MVRVLGRKEAADRLARESYRVLRDEGDIKEAERWVASNTSEVKLIHEIELKEEGVRVIIDHADEGDISDFKIKTLK